MTKEVKILIAIAVVVVIGGVLLAVFANPQPQQPGKALDGKSLVRDNSHMTGNKDAKVTVVEFGDYQCPACGQASPELDKAIDYYKDNSNVNFVFRNFPLDTIHPNAQIAAEAVEAAGAQGKYWEMNRLMYKNQTEWAESLTPIDFFVKYASELGLNTDQFKSSVDQRLFKDVIAADYKDGEAEGVDSTPTFFINGTKHPGVTSFDDWKKLIDDELAK